MGLSKAGLSLGNHSFLHHVSAVLRDAGCFPLLAVEGAHPLEIDPDVVRVRAEAWEFGPLSSLQSALRALNEIETEIAGVLVATVDRPRVRVETVRAMIASYSADPGFITQPRHGPHSGHPILYPAAAISDLLRLDRQESARALVRGSWSARRRFVDVDDPGVLENFDTPEDLPSGVDVPGRARLE
jgi:CTP:molybdopterin cytidylyltransferase MocA